MALAYQHESGLLRVFVARGELAPKKRRTSGATTYWALTALMALSEKELEQYPITCWHFDPKMKPAVHRIFAAKECPLQYTDQETCLRLVQDVLDGLSKDLKLPVDKAS